MTTELSPATPLQERFESLKATFAPKFDPAKKWTVVATSDDYSHGTCCRTQKVIDICSAITEEDEIDARILHELAHVTTTMWHSDAWEEKLLSFATKAESLGCYRVSLHLRDDITACREVMAMSWSDFKGWRDASTEKPTRTAKQIEQEISKSLNIEAKSIKGMGSYYRKSHHKSWLIAVKIARFQDVGPRRPSR